MSQVTPPFGAVEADFFGNTGVVVYMPDAANDVIERFSPENGHGRCVTQTNVEI